MRRLVKWPLLGTAAATCAAGAYAWMHAPLPVMDVAGEFSEQTVLRLSADAGLSLQALTVEGRVMTSREDLLAAVDAEIGSPILDIDVAKVRDAIALIPWVKTAQVERRLPGKIHIIITERTPALLWQRETRYTLVDREGHEIVDVPAGQDFPLIVGPDAPKYAAELFDTLSTVPELAARVRAAVHIGERRWNVHFDSTDTGIAVRLPEKDIAAAWSRLATLEREHRILERDLEFIDLRLPDQLIVKLNKSAEEPPTVGTVKTPALKADGPKHKV